MKTHTLVLPCALALAAPAGANVGDRAAGGRPYSVLSVGELSSCAVLSDGTVECWGANDFGQLGSGGKDTARHPPALVDGLAGVVSVGVGRYFGCALSVDGGVRCWGSNGRGWLGDASTTDHFAPTQVQGPLVGQPLGQVKALSVGRNHSCAVNSAGNVFCWGSNSNGQLGDGTTVDRALATPAAANARFVDVAVGAVHTCALASDGRVWCWGNNSKGQLGDGTTDGSTTPRPSLVDNARALASGSTHSCAVLVDGTVACWGSDDYHETGSCGKGQCAISTANGMTNARSIAVGDQYACALAADGKVACWGRNDFHQLGGAAWGASASAVTVTAIDAVALATGVATTCAATAGGQVLCWGDNMQGEAGDVGTKPLDASAPNVVALARVAMGPSPAASAGTYSSCALTAGGKAGQPAARCWGDNAANEIGDGSTVERITPGFTAPTAGWPVSVVSGAYFHCALESSGSSECWGTSNAGALGDGGTVAAVPTPVIGGGKGAGIALSAGYDFALELLSDGSLLAWGDNSDGQLGTGSYTPSGLPVSVAGAAHVTAVAAGAFHACALLVDGSVACWGDNTYGQLGNGGWSGSPVPEATLPLARPAIALTAGWYHTCALLDDGSVQCWGYNGYGALGNGTTIGTVEPTLLVDACAHSVCAANAGALASGCDNVATTVCASDPYCCTVQWDAVCVSEVASLAGQDCGQGVDRAIALAAGGFGTCALVHDGTLSCWGWNGHGQLGAGDGGDRKSPWQAMPLGGVVGASAGGLSTCASRADGGVWCWGYNGYGEVGDGTLTERDAPVPAIGFP